jgi:energy-coupling factor transport system permease protein
MGGSLNARVWAVWVIAAALPALITRNPLYLIVALLAVAVVRSQIGEGGLPIGRFGLIAVTLATLWNALTVHYGDTLLVRLPASLPVIGGPITLEALIFGASNGLAVWLLFAAFATFNSAVTPYQVLSLAPRALRHAGLVVSIALAFFPRALRTAREVHEAQAVRGHRPRRLRDLPATFVPLLLNNLENAMQIAEAMEARGYGRTTRTGLRSSVGWVALLIGALIQLYWQDAAVGWIVLAIGAGWLIASGRHGQLVTRYRRERWSTADAIVGLVSFISIGVMWIVSLNNPAALAYYPYPRATLPPLQPVMLLALVFLIAPAVRLPRWRIVSSEPASEL